MGVGFMSFRAWGFRKQPANHGESDNADYGIEPINVAPTDCIDQMLGYRRHDQRTEADTANGNTKRGGAMMLEPLPDARYNRNKNTAHAKPDAQAIQRVGLPQ